MTTTNQVDYRQWAEAVDDVTDEEFAVHKADFDKFDKDGSGKLDGDELEQLVMHQLGRKPDRAILDAFLKSFDVDSDGKIDLNEYLNVVLGKGWKVVPKAAPGAA